MENGWEFIKNCCKYLRELYCNYPRSEELPTPFCLIDICPILQQIRNDINCINCIHDKLCVLHRFLSDFTLTNRDRIKFFRGNNYSYIAILCHNFIPKIDK